MGVWFLLAAAAALYLRYFSPLDRDWVISALSSHYKCDVDLASFHSSLFPAISMSGQGLVLRRRDQPDLPPLASIERFSVSAHWTNLIRHPRRFGEVRLTGLQLNIPPRRSSNAPAGSSENATANKSARKKLSSLAFVLDRVIADGTTLNIYSSKPGKEPTVFEIQRLRLRSAGIGAAMHFDAVLTNPRPVGQIYSVGSFGPWNADDPSQTAVKGTYRFQHADLSTIRGLKGILSSTGTYDGMLSYINVHGETETPDFGLSIGGNPVDLHTTFEAVVDGVNGDTFLRPVTAKFLSTTIVAVGGEAKTNGRQGRTIMLDVTANPARLEDLMRLVMKSSKPSMIGNVRIKAKLDLPPGEEDINRRLKLKADFNIDSARFTDPDTEGKIKNISRIGLGKHGTDEVDKAPLSMNGRFVLGSGTTKFSTLSFGVPGANIQLHGTYGLDSEALDFEGTASMQARVSQMTTGVKSVLLKALDPLLARDGKGAVLPIHITGTRDHPSFHLEIGKIFRH